MKKKKKQNWPEFSDFLNTNRFCTSSPAAVYRVTWIRDSRIHMHVISLTRDRVTEHVIYLT